MPKVFHALLLSFSQDVICILYPPMSCRSDACPPLDATSNAASILYTNKCHWDGKTVTNLIFLILCHMGQKRTVNHWYFKDSLSIFPSIFLPPLPRSLSQACNWIRNLKSICIVLWLPQKYNWSMKSQDTKPHFSSP